MSDIETHRLLGAVAPEHVEEAMRVLLAYGVDFPDDVEVTTTTDETDGQTTTEVHPK